MVRYFFFIWSALTLGACTLESGDIRLLDRQVISHPYGFPEMAYPEDNHFTPERWKLGKALFFDTRLSRTNTLSCASCHRPELAFSDLYPVSNGVEGRVGTRNVPSLSNIGYHPYYTREGGVPTLEMQVLVPIQEHNEFDFNILEIADRLSLDSMYTAMSMAAYDRPMDYYVITRAIANFERTLISGNSPYDQFLRRRNLPALHPDQRKGMDLFFSERTQCASCHAGFNFTNYAFENNGLYESYMDPGRKRLTGKESDLALFKVPSLRNIALTGPYMHDGSIQTLEDVIDHYDSGGQNHVHKSKLIRPLHLTGAEKKYLTAFLRSLTDQDFITNPDFNHP